MADLTRYKVPVIWKWETEGPRWTWLWIREGTSDQDVLREIVEQDVYHLRGLELTSVPNPRGGADLMPLIVDIGANTGIFSVMAAAQFPTAEIWAVEPDLANLEVLYRNVGPLGSRARVIDVAVGAEKADVDWGGSDAQAHVLPAAAAASADRWGVVRQVPLTDIITAVETAARPVALLKIDVEGAEYEIIEAAPVGLLDRVERIVMEWHGPREAPWRENAGDWPIGALVEKLQHTHSCQIIGKPDRGGMLYAHHA